MEGIPTAACTKSSHQQVVVSGSRVITVSESGRPWSSLHSSQYCSVCYFWNTLHYLWMHELLAVILLLILHAGIGQLL